ncbi:hypothetical protein ACFV5G_36205 [Streptomyces sp. NPDC059766]|uniref:hypothetical protein n=1 Tax=Streptomyces sp. NPDC059766 TaxID=3346940 RepID=UPI00364C4A75
MGATDHLFAGVLCAIDRCNDPVAVYGALASLHPPRIDFLLPRTTWTPRPSSPMAPAPRTQTGS